MKNLLYLTHRIPFPPNKGDKIRSYHLLRHLASRYRVYLGTFIDDPADWEYVNEVKALCAETFIMPLHPLAARVRSIAGFALHAPLTLGYYRDGRMRLWVEGILAAQRIDHALVFSSAMAQYLDGCNIARRVIDYVDVDSDKWRQYARSKPWPLSSIYRREARCLLEYERKVAAAYDRATFVSRAEAALFKQLAPESAAKIESFNNGVDAEYFSPGLQYANPYPGNVLPLVFTGAMDYWANAEAVLWFARRVFPAVRARRPDAVFYIVGARPTLQVKALGKLAGITVTGSVPDVRPYVAHARLAVAPLRIARGVQNKVLEAMAMAKTVIASPEAAEGIEALIGKELLVAGDEREFGRLILAHLPGRKRSTIGQAARRRVVQSYSWQAGLERVQALLDGRGASNGAPARGAIAAIPTGSVAA